jgi:hypothetical protein
MAGRRQGDLGLLEDPVARELLASRQPAHLGYTWTDGTPRVVPLWFHWTGEQITFGSPPRAPKLAALRANPRVAVTIDQSGTWPYHVLMVRGDAAVELCGDVTPEYEASAHRYFGDQAETWLGQLRGRSMARVAVTPTWAAIIDFETRLPSALTG